MNQSTSRPELPLRRDTECHQDLNGSPDAVSHSGWRRLLALVLAALKGLGLLSCEAHQEESGIAIGAPPQSTESRKPVVLNGSDIHELVVATFSELGVPASINVCETLFVTDGFFIGHKFHCDGGCARVGAQAGMRWNSMARTESC